MAEHNKQFKNKNKQTEQETEEAETFLMNKKWYRKLDLQQKQAVEMLIHIGLETEINIRITNKNKTLMLIEQITDAGTIEVDISDIPPIYAVLKRSSSINKDDQEGKENAQNQRENKKDDEGSFNPYGNGQTTMVDKNGYIIQTQTQPEQQIEQYSGMRDFTRNLFGLNNKRDNIKEGVENKRMLAKRTTNNQDKNSCKSDRVGSIAEWENKEEATYNSFIVLLQKHIYDFVENSELIALLSSKIPASCEIDWNEDPECNDIDIEITEYKEKETVPRNNMNKNDKQGQEKQIGKNNITEKIRSTSGNKTTNKGENGQVQSKRVNNECDEMQILDKLIANKNTGMNANEIADEADCIKGKLSSSRVMYYIAKRLTKGMSTDIEVLQMLVKKELTTGFSTSQIFIKECLKGKQTTKMGERLIHLYISGGSRLLMIIPEMTSYYKEQIKPLLYRWWYTNENVSKLKEMEQTFAINFVDSWIKDLTKEGIEPNPGPSLTDSGEMTNDKTIKKQKRMKKIARLQHNPIKYNDSAKNYYTRQIIEKATELLGHIPTEQEINKMIQEGNESSGILDKIITTIAHYITGESAFIGPGYMGQHHGPVRDIHHLAQLLAVAPKHPDDEAAREHDLVYSLTKDPAILRQADQKLAQEATSKIVEGAMHLKTAYDDLRLPGVFSYWAPKQDITISGDVEKNPGPVDIAKLLAKIAEVVRSSGLILSPLTNTRFSYSESMNYNQQIERTYINKFAKQSNFTAHDRYGTRDAIMDVYTGIPLTWPDGIAGQVQIPAQALRIATGWTYVAHGNGTTLRPTGITKSFNMSEDQYMQLLAAYRTNLPIFNGDLAYLIWFLTKGDDTITFDYNSSGGNNAHILFNIWNTGVMISSNTGWRPYGLRAEGYSCRIQATTPNNAYVLWPRYIDTTWNGWVMSLQSFVGFQTGAVALNPALNGMNITFCWITADMLNPQNALARVIWAGSAGPMGFLGCNAQVSLSLWDTAGGAEVLNSPSVDRDSSVYTSVTAPKHIIFIRADLGNTQNGAVVQWDMPWGAGNLTFALNDAAQAGTAPFNLAPAMANYIAQLTATTDAPFRTAERWWTTLFGSKKDWAAARMMFAINNHMFFPVPSFPLADPNLPGIPIIPDMLKPNDPLSPWAPLRKNATTLAGIQEVFCGTANSPAKDCMGMELFLLPGANPLIGDISLTQYRIAPMSPVRQYAMIAGLREYANGDSLKLSEVAPFNAVDFSFQMLELSAMIRKVRDDMSRQLGMSEFCQLGSLLGPATTSSHIPAINSAFFSSMMENCGIEGWFTITQGLTYSRTQVGGRGKILQYIYDYSFANTPYYINEATDQSRPIMAGEQTQSMQLAYNNNVLAIQGYFKEIDDPNISNRFYFDERFWGVSQNTVLKPQALGTIGIFELSANIKVYASQNIVNSISRFWTSHYFLIGPNPPDYSYNIKEYIPDHTAITLSGESYNREVRISIDSGTENAFINSEFHAYVALIRHGAFSTTNLNFINVVSLPDRAHRLIYGNQSNRMADDERTKK